MFVSSGAVFTTSPEVDKRRVDAIKTSVAQRATLLVKVKSHELRKPQHVQSFRDTILNTFGYSMSVLKTSMGKPTQL